MNPGRKESIADGPDRRRAPRSNVEYPAQLHLISGIRAGVLLDLSRTGARFQTPSPPRVGNALLQWDMGETFCKVVWATEDTCGLAFDRALPRHLVDETVQEDERRHGPVASVTNIPLGQKRVRR